MTSGPSDYLAAERTFLAWIRTGLALVGFGFVVARFGLFLRALQITQPSLADSSYGLSFWFGTALIILGANRQYFVRETSRTSGSRPETGRICLQSAVLACHNRCTASGSDRISSGDLPDFGW